MMGKLIFSNFLKISMQRLISLHATSAFMKCKISALSLKFLSV